MSDVFVLKILFKRSQENALFLIRYKYDKFKTAFDYNCIKTVQYKIAAAFVITYIDQ